jgi:phosphoenolpyruvate synthase/pyruvate phosphate dikinase
MRFRTSTNSEDLEGFPCAGCYESQTGDPAAWDDVLNAIRTTWASIWLFRTFEERSYYGIDHKSVGMALLVHHNFPDEEANGVATTNNPYDPSGLEPAFYVNVQWGGEAEVVHPPAGVTSDQFLYYFDNPNQPITFISHSNLVADGENVLTLSQTHELGVALSAIHERFSEAYGPAAGNDGWYAMDVEFKFDDRDSPGDVPKLYVKQARPYPGRGESE